MHNFHSLTDLGLYVDHKTHALICFRPECECALFVDNSRVTSHLRDKHKIPEEARKGVTKFLKSLSPQCANPDQLDPLKDGSSTHEFLRLHDGFACDGCDFRTVSLQSITRHYSDPSMQEQCTFNGVLRRRREDIDTLFRYVYLQTWLSGPARRYWIVEHNGSVLRPIGGQKAQDHLKAVRERELERQHASRRESHGLTEVRTTFVAGPGPEKTGLSFAEEGPWIERTKWEETYRGKDRDLLSARWYKCRCVGQASWLKTFP